MIVDAHQHFWDPDRADYPWMTESLAAIRRPFGPDDLAPLLERTGVDQTVLIQARASSDETTELLAIAAATPFVAGVVGWVDLTDVAVADSIARLRGEVGGASLVGIRHPLHDEPDPAWLSRADVRRGLVAAQQAGLAYDLLVRPRELPAALEIARALPDLRFVIDHLAKPPIRDRRLQPWADLLEPFGELPNVACKVSGLVTEADWTGWRAGEFSRYVDRAVEIFGPRRLLFGSDWPVCLVAAPYQGVHALAQRLLSRLGDAERAAIFGDNAVEVYGLGTSA